MHRKKATAKSIKKFLQSLLLIGILVLTTQSFSSVETLSLLLSLWLKALRCLKRRQWQEFFNKLKWNNTRTCCTFLQKYFEYGVGSFLNVYYAMQPCFVAFTVQCYTTNYLLCIIDVQFSKAYIIYFTGSRDTFSVSWWLQSPMSENCEFPWAW